MPIWPPQQPLWSWFERVWFAPMERWDTHYYISIAASGYSSVDGSSQFHPLFPLLAAPLVKLGIPPLVSLSLLSTLTSLGLLIAFYKLALLDLNQQKSSFAIWMLLCSPFAFALFIPYSESLFLLFAVLSLYLARMQRWWLAGLAAAMATLTRQQGVFLVLPLAWELWESSGRKWNLFLKHFRAGQLKNIRTTENNPLILNRFAGWSLVLVPVAYSAWILFRAYAVGDVSMDFTNLNAFVYTLLISPNAVRVVPFQEFIWPWQALAMALYKLCFATDIDIITNLMWAFYYLILLTIAWQHLRTSYRVYCLATTLVSFAYHTGPYFPYMGLLRHLLLGFPVFIGLVSGVNSTKSRLFLSFIGLLGFFQLIMLFSFEFWVP